MFLLLPPIVKVFRASQSRVVLIIQWSYLVRSGIDKFVTKGGSATKKKIARFYALQLNSAAKFVLRNNSYFTSNKKHFKM